MQLVPFGKKDPHFQSVPQGARWVYFWPLPEFVTDVAGSIYSSVFGDTCDFTATAEWEGASDGAEVGKLTCSEWSDATCYKSNVEGSCLGDILVVDLVYCGWNA